MKFPSLVTSLLRKVTMPMDERIQLGEDIVKEYVKIEPFNPELPNENAKLVNKFKYYAEKPFARLALVILYIWLSSMIVRWMNPEDYYQDEQDEYGQQ